MGAEIRRGDVGAGFVLMLINRIRGLVLPYSTKFLIDFIIAKHHIERLRELVLIVLGAEVADSGITSFSLTQLLSKAAQRLIGRRCKLHIVVLRCEQNGKPGLARRERVEGMRLGAWPSLSAGWSRPASRWCCCSVPVRR